MYEQIENCRFVTDRKNLCQFLHFNHNVLVSFLGLFSPLLNHFTDVILTVFLTSLQITLVTLEGQNRNTLD
jgi:hypothetical protein